MSLESEWNSVMLREKKRPRRRVFEGGSVDRLPPHSPEAEAGALGCCLLDPRACIGKCVELFADGAEVFYDLRHQVIFKAMVEMGDVRAPVDVISLQQWLKDLKLLDEVGGAAYLSSMPDAVPSAANLEYYARILVEKATLRKLLRVCAEIVGKVYDFEGEVSPLLDEAERAVLGVRGKVGAEMREAKVIVREALNELEKLHSSGGALMGLPSGFADLDKITGGFQPELYVIAGFTSTGKTSLAMQFAEYIALEAHHPAGVFSLEMDARTLMIRTLTGRSKIDIYDVRDGALTEQDFVRLAAAAGQISQANNLWIDDSSSLSVGQMKAKARRLVAQYGVKMIVVDQVSLVEGGDEETRQLQIDRINLACQQISRELSVPVFAIAQLNESGELRESRAGGHHSGGVLKLVPVEPLEETIGQPMMQIDLIVTKLRNGRTGKVPLVFDKPHTRFLPRSKVDDADVPRGNYPSYDHD